MFFLPSIPIDFNRDIIFSAKMSGSVGNMTTHKVVFPEISWHEFFDFFFEEKLDLKRNSFTTQIDNYDDCGENVYPEL